MKRAEQLALMAMGGLLLAALILFAGGFAYRFTGFWAGAVLVSGQALVMGLAWWGLSLARQARELNELPEARLSGQPGPEIGSTFRMSMGGDEKTERTSAGLDPDEPRVLDTGFQRLLVGISGIILVALSVILAYAVYYTYHWVQINPQLKLPLAGPLGAKTPTPMDEMALLIGLAGSGIYLALYWLTRPSRQTGVHGDAASSNFTLGLTGMAALGVATVLAYFKVLWASEIATGVIAAFLLLQGMELLVNACRSYSSIEELEQEAVDLQATPIGPMLASVWLGGLRMLLAQSVGLSGDGRKGETSVIARMMPRVLLALVVIAIGLSCIRVVPPGQVAILERLGYTPVVGPEDRRPLPEAILYPGPHLTFPWPIDRLVYLPTEELQLTEVGTELHATGEWKNIDFQFWMVRAKGSDVNEVNDLFNTGDPGSSQFLETFVQVRWRVADPARFYAAMSHSGTFEKSAEGGDAREMPIYAALVQQATSQAVTQAFAIHSLEQIMIVDREEVELHCRQILQDKLDHLCALPGDKPGDKHRGIDVAYLTIKDLHPPYAHPDRPDNTKPVIGGVLSEDETGYSVISPPERSTRIDRGPASAFELVVSMREFKQQIINTAESQEIAIKNQAHGEAQSELANAHTYSAQKVAQARGEADRFVEMTRGMSALDLALMERRLLLNTTRDLFDPVTKIIVDPRAGEVQIIQNTEKNSGGFRPPGQ